MVRFRVSVFYFLFSFCTGFILLFPIPYYFLPETGNFFEPLVLPFIKSIAHAFFGVSDPFTAHLYSDSVSLYVLVFLLGVISVLVSVFSVFLNGREVNEKSKYILSKDCIKPSGTFAVENGFTYSTTDSILSTCYDGKSQCTFTGVDSLTDAINICNINNLCSRFAYNSSSQTVTFLKPDSSYVKNVNSDIYNRQ